MSDAIKNQSIDDPYTVHILMSSRLKLHFETRILKDEQWFKWDLRLCSLDIAKNNLSLADYIDFSMRKNNSDLQNFFQSCWIDFFILHTFLVPLDKATYSGQGSNVQPNCICHCVNFCVQVSYSTAQPSRQLKIYELWITQHLKLMCEE